MKKLFSIAAISIAIGILAFATQASAFTLPDPTDTLVPALGGYPVASYHGDFYSYSLPLLALNENLINGTAMGPGSPYYVASTPGAIKDDIVVATGASGGPLNDNSNWGLMDDAYPTPSGVHGSTTFSTTVTADPAPSFAASGDTTITWDATLSGLTNYLDGQDLIFFFNHNEDNSGNATEQSLWGWGRIALVDLQGNLTTKYLFFADNGTTYEPTASNFVLAPGQMNIGPYTINNNLGADQAAYAIISPELNDILNDLSNPLYSDYDVLQLELRLSGLSNGYEQLFIQRGDRVTNIIPEPASIVLLGTGLLGAFGLIRRKKK
jgi:hypothetical protein